MESWKKEAIEQNLFHSTRMKPSRNWLFLSLCVQLEKQKLKAIVCVFNVTIIIARLVGCAGSVREDTYASID